MFNQVLHGMGSSSGRYLRDGYQSMYESCRSGVFGFSHLVMMGGLFLIAIIGLIIYLIVSKNNSKKQDGGIKKSNAALEVLENEFARGNITEAEYVRKRSILNK